MNPDLTWSLFSCDPMKVFESPIRRLTRTRFFPPLCSPRGSFRYLYWVPPALTCNDTRRPATLQTDQESQDLASSFPNFARSDNLCDQIDFILWIDRCFLLYTITYIKLNDYRYVLNHTLYFMAGQSILVLLYDACMDQCLSNCAYMHNVKQQ